MKRMLQTILRWYSKLILWKYRPAVVAVTGSVGKTGTKEAVAVVLSAKFTVRKNAGNFNTEIGVPLTILGAGHWFTAMIKAKLWFWLPLKYPKVLILEMAADRPGDLAYLTGFVKPSVSVVTAVGPSHMEFFGSLKKIAEEKSNLVTSLGSAGTAVLNYDDLETRAMSARHRGKTIFYGFGEGADVRAGNVIETLEGTSFKVEYGGNVVPVRLPKSVGKPNIYSALAALAVGLSFGMNLVESSRALAVFKSLPGRMTVLAGVKSSTLIDDCYNAAPASMLAGLEVLARIPGKRKIAVLGDMAELGQYTEDGHRLVGAALVDRGINYLVAVGQRARFIADQAIQMGYPENQVRYYDDSGAAKKPVEELIEPGDAILIKGSQSMRMERITKEIMAEPERTSELLCRQSPEWLKNI